MMKPDDVVFEDPKEYSDDQRSQIQRLLADPGPYKPLGLVEPFDTPLSARVMYVCRSLRCCRMWSEVWLTM